MTSVEKETEVVGICVTIPRTIFEQIEKDRAVVPRSAYIREVLKRWLKNGHSVDEIMEEAL